MIADEVCRPSYSVTETGGLLEYRHSRPALATYQDPASKIKRALQDGSAAKGMCSPGSNLGKERSSSHKLSSVWCGEQAYGVHPRKQRTWKRSEMHG